MQKPKTKKALKKVVRKKPMETIKPVEGQPDNPGVDWVTVKHGWATTPNWVKWWAVIATLAAVAGIVF